MISNPILKWELKLKNYGSTKLPLIKNTGKRKEFP
jgi:hypothetical protein